MMSIRVINALPKKDNHKSVVCNTFLSYNGLFNPGSAYASIGCTLNLPRAVNSYANTKYYPNLKSARFNKEASVKSTAKINTRSEATIKGVFNHFYMTTAKYTGVSVPVDYDIYYIDENTNSLVKGFHDDSMLNALVWYTTSNSLRDSSAMIDWNLGSTNFVVDVVY